jgi:DNA-binding response OmpR family regulator
MSDISILLAEDDAKLGRTIQLELEENGYQTDLAFDGKIAESLYRTHTYHLILLDINLPHKNGWELCKLIRSSNKDIPIIMLTALGELEDKMEAFKAGADDYLIKPFHLTELLARIKVFIKRMNKVGDVDDLLSIGDLELNVSTRTVNRSGKEIKLTTKEFLLLELLMRNKGRVISKSTIAEKIWNINFETGTNTIEVYINFLRNKIDKPFQSQLIQTKPGFGYTIKEE